jgi:hypothetical protein
MDAKYTIFDDGRRLPTGGPLNHEDYGPAWVISLANPPVGYESPICTIHDPGDGSAEPLARKILEVINSIAV